MLIWFLSWARRKRFGMQIYNVIIIVCEASADIIVFTATVSYFLFVMNNHFNLYYLLSLSLSLLLAQRLCFYRFDEFSSALTMGWVCIEFSLTIYYLNFADINQLYGLLLWNLAFYRHRKVGCWKFQRKGKSIDARYPNFRALQTIFNDRFSFL